MRIGALRKGGERDHEAALAFMIRTFREGKLGRWTIDNLESGLGIPSPATAEAQGGIPPATFSVDDRSLPEHPVPEVNNDPTTPAAVPTTLNEAVSHAVRDFLSTAATTQARMDDGQDLSISQKRKADIRAKNEARISRWKAKGTGTNPSRSQTQRRRKQTR